ncbi:M20/M25/M40 family metallo-hydrolase, partial [Mesorhizobium sp. M4A.F.Ca.ET.020.02.1.1]|uniref:M20/M25/M40 family metallo-hydrolase n=1 Tax=Mesorhizobium sp. M4A.F.Ca.ET.020.02.1.1 TaxID=2496652 RepID=UPI000FD3FF7A
LREEESGLAAFLEDLAASAGVTVQAESLARFEPVTFDARIVSLVEEVAGAAGLSCRRITSGAGHDAQMIARIAPSAMIFVPSRGGISHNPAEFTAAGELVAGANILLGVAARLAAD